MSAKLPKQLEAELKDLGLSEEAPDSDLEALPAVERLEKVRELPITHQKFLESYLGGKIASKAYMEVFPNASKATAYNKGYLLVRQYGWVIQAALEAAGVTPTVAAKRHKALLFHRSGKIALGALKLFYQQFNQENAKKAVSKVSNLIIVKDSRKGVFKVSSIEDGQVV